MGLIAYQFAPVTGTALVIATLLLIVGQLSRAFSLSSERGVERGTSTAPVRGDHRLRDSSSLYGGLDQPDGFRARSPRFADEFFARLRPL